MENLSILFTEPGVAKLLSTPLNHPKPGEILVKTVVSTISSGTERANLNGEANTSWMNRTQPAEFPRRGGYSSSGIVIEVGEGVTDVKPGDCVAMSWSAHSLYNCISVGNVSRIDPDTVSFEEAALLHIGTFPMAAIRKCHLELGESAVVMGLGVLGRIAVMQLRAAGAVPVIAVDPVAEKREQALRFGADLAFDPFEPDFAEQVKAATGGGTHVAIEVTGNGKALDQALDCTARFGRVALLGCTRNSDFTIDYYHKVHGPGITLIGAHTAARPEHDSSSGLWSERADIGAQIDLIRHGRYRMADMVEETHSPVDAPEVYHRLSVEKAFPLVQFDWRMLG